MKPGLALAIAITLFAAPASAGFVGKLEFTPPGCKSVGNVNSFTTLDISTRREWAGKQRPA